MAPKHFDTHFLRINVENAPFLVTKLKVRVLPCVICFVDGVGIDRVVGFEGLEGGDRFTTTALEARLLQCGVLTRAKMNESMNSGRGYSVPNERKLVNQIDDGDDDDDWD